MTTEQFVYWLQGFAELNVDPPSAEQWQAIRDHLALVFEKKTPMINIKVTEHHPEIRRLMTWPDNIQWPSAPVITC